METIEDESRLENKTVDSAMQPREHRYEDDSVSLVDLVAVVIRYRVMIIGGTVLTGIIMLLALYFGPILGLGFGTRAEYTAQQNLLVKSIPPRVSQYIDTDPAIRLQAILNDPIFVGEVFAAFEEEAPTDQTQERYLAMIRQIIMGDSYNVEWDARTRALTLYYTSSTPDDAAAFLEAIVSQGTLVLKNQMDIQLEDARAALERTINESRIVVAQLIEQSIPSSDVAVSETSVSNIVSYLENTGSESLSTFVSRTGDLDILRSLVQENHQLITSLGEIAVFDESPEIRRALITVIPMFVVFSAMVFLAFIFEFVRRVKQEPKDMQKLRAAWRGE